MNLHLRRVQRIESCTAFVSAENTPLVARQSKKSANSAALWKAVVLTEYTQYSAVIPPNSFRKGMELEADALRYPDLSEAMLPEENALSLLEEPRNLRLTGKSTD